MMNSEGRTDGDQARWEREAEFFDRHAEAAAVGPLDPRVIERYRRCTMAEARFPLEFAVACAGPLEGKRIIDVGCGEGGNAVLFAALGATVTGIDLSSKAIDVARRRAEASSVGERCKFSVANAEMLADAGEIYDVVWCEAVLHHVIPNLQRVLGSIRALTGPHGSTVILEPIALSPFLRTMRRLAPMASDATPDERPLRGEEIAAVESAFPGIRSRRFRITGRLDRLVLNGQILEHASRFQARIVRALAQVDMRLERIGLGRFGSVTVMWTRGH